MMCKQVSKRKILIPLEYCSVDRAVRMFSEYNVEKEDIEHWLDIGAISASVILDGHFMTISSDEGKDLELSKEEKAQLAEQIAPSNDFILLEQHENIPEELTFLARTARFVKGYGIWKVSSILSDDMAILSPTLTPLRFSFLTLEFNNLTYVLEKSELEKILTMVTTGNLEHNTNNSQHHIQSLPIEMQETIMALVKNPIRTKNLDSLQKAMGLMSELLKNSSQKYRKGNLPNFDQIAKSLEHLAASKGVEYKGLSNLSIDLSKSHKYSFRNQK
ncbi:hypothetical protein ACP3VW_05920 [Vibrio sp. DNB22_17_1]